MHKTNSNNFSIRTIFLSLMLILRHKIEVNFFILQNVVIDGSLDDQGGNSSGNTNR